MALTLAIVSFILRINGRGGSFNVCISSDLMTFFLVMNFIIFSLPCISLSWASLLPQVTSLRMLFGSAFLHKWVNFPKSPLPLSPSPFLLAVSDLHKVQLIIWCQFWSFYYFCLSSSNVDLLTGLRPPQGFSSNLTAVCGEIISCWRARNRCWADISSSWVSKLAIRRFSINYHCLSLMLHLCVIKAGASPTEQHDISLAALPPAPLQSWFPFSVSYFWGVHIDISLTKLYLNFFLSQAPSEYANQLTAWRTFSLVRSLFCWKK